MLYAPTSFFYLTDKYKNGILDLCHCGTDICHTDSKIGPIIKPFYLIHYILRGHGTFAVGKDFYRLGPGDAFLIRPDEVVVYTADKIDPWQYCFFSFNGSAALQYVDRTAFNDSYVIHVGNDEIYDYVNESTLFFSSLTSNLDVHALGFLIRLLTFFADKSKTELDMHSEKPIREDIRRIMDYAALNYNTPLTVSQMASMVSMERSYFYRLFKKEVGLSPKEYVIGLRLEKARDLITETSLSIGSIAEIVGFQSFSSFSRLFTAHFRQSPGQYRRSFLKDDLGSNPLGSH